MQAYSLPMLMSNPSPFSKLLEPFVRKIIELFFFLSFLLN